MIKNEIIIIIIIIFFYFLEHEIDNTINYLSSRHAPPSNLHPISVKCHTPKGQNSFILPLFPLTSTYSNEFENDSFDWIVNLFPHTSSAIKKSCLLCYSPGISFLKCFRISLVEVALSLKM